MFLFKKSQNVFEFNYQFDKFTGLRIIIEGGGVFQMKLKVYGCRGTIPTYRKTKTASKYGSNTTCMTIESEEHAIILDAGSGLAQMDRFTKIFSRNNKPFDILLGHLHMDHIIGLTVFSQIWLKDAPVRIYTLSRGERPLKEQIFAPFNPPYWPVSMTQFSNVECLEIKYDVPFELGGFTITPFEAAHHDKTSSFHIESGNAKIVYLIDSEMQELSEKGREVLLKYCKNADLVIFDSSYSAVDYPEKKGWGHSSIDDGFELAEESGCKKMLFSHLSFEYGDQELELLESYVLQKSDSFYFARDGLEIVF